MPSNHVWTIFQPSPLQSSSLGRSGSPQACSDHLVHRTAHMEALKASIPPGWLPSCRAAALASGPLAFLHLLPARHLGALVGLAQGPCLPSRENGHLNGRSSSALRVCRPGGASDLAAHCRCWLGTPHWRPSMAWPQRIISLLSHKFRLV
jgi:hypothetical protein